MKTQEEKEDLFEDFNLDSIPERVLFANYVSYKDKTYTFTTAGYLIINGEETNTLDIVLTPKEVSEIRDWFFLRGKRWIGYVPIAFREHSPKLYDKLYQALVDRTNLSDPDLLTDEPYPEIVYDPNIDPYDEDCPWGALLWPEQLFEEMDINIPNVSIWVTNKTLNELHGMGYPIYLEDNYIDELHTILVKTIWNKDSRIGYINIDNLADKHENLRNTIRERIKDRLINDYDCPEDTLSNLTFSLYFWSIRN